MKVFKRIAAVAAVLGLVAAIQAGVAQPARAAAYVPINGAGSTWSENAIRQWASNVEQYGMRINYEGNGSSQGRNQFASGLTDFGVSEIPYRKDDGAATEAYPKFGFAYMPIVAGGTSFMYNLRVGNRLVTNLRLSGDTVAKIFTRVITKWDDPAIKADNPGLALPARQIVPVVRSDGSGTTAQLTTWLAARYPEIWNAYCARAGRRTPCGITSLYPLVSGVVAQSGSQSVAGYVAQEKNVGTITYVEYSYALYAHYPVVKLRNQANYYVEPTAQSVAVALLKAKINTKVGSTDYLTQDLSGVYVNPDRRAYPLSSYSYMMIPVGAVDPVRNSRFTAAKGRTLGDFAYYFLCEGQQQADQLGYSPLPINLVQAGLTQVRRIPGVVVQNKDIKTCNNPTFSKDGTNTLATNAPYPSECDKVGVTQCTKGTAGAKAETPSQTGGRRPTATTTRGPSGAATPVPGSTATSGPPAAVDPDTGQSVGGVAGGAGDTAEAIPVSVGSEIDPGTRTGLLVVAALLVLLLTVGPPLAARALNRRGGR